MFSDRYILASALQKSIRRGQTEYALKYSEILGQEDYNYLIYRLGIILTEDVGVSNTTLLNEYLDLKISKKSIEAAGGLDFIQDIITKACLSNKDRSSCDLAYFSSHLTEWAISKPEFQSVINAPEAERLNLIKSFIVQNINPALKLNLIWAALGQRKYPNELLTNLSLFEFPKLKNGKNDDSIDNFTSILKTLGLNEAEISATVNAHATQNEFMCLGMAITYPERTQFIQENQKTNPDFECDVQKIDFYDSSSSIMKSLNIPILNAAIDHHTSQGKAAYTMFLKTDNEYTKYMSSIGLSHEQATSLLPFFMFRIEGHEVNNREYFPFAKTVMLMANQISLNIRLGLDFNDKTYSFKNIAEVLKTQIPIINQFREKSLNFGFKTPRSGFNI